MTRLNGSTRALSPRQTNYSMLAYQDMPLAPARASNREQARIVAEQAALPTAVIPKKRGRPAKPKAEPKPKPVKPAPVVKPPKPVKDRTERYAKQGRTRIQNAANEVRELFSAGPLTVNQVMAAKGYVSRTAAGVMVNTWAKRGLVRKTSENFYDPSQEGMRGGPRKQALWELA